MFISAAAKAAKDNARLEACKKATEAFLAQAQQAGCLPTVQSSLNMKAGEIAVYDAPAKLYETRAVRHYKSGGGSVRVAKGVWIHSGRGKSTSSQEWQQVDNGTLTVTNKRIVFVGEQGNRNAAIEKVLSVSASIRGAEVLTESKQKAMVFSAANPVWLATIIDLTVKAANSEPA